MQLALWERNKVVLRCPQANPIRRKRDGVTAGRMMRHPEERIRMAGIGMARNSEGVVIAMVNEKIACNNERRDDADEQGNSVLFTGVRVQLHCSTGKTKSAKSADPDNQKHDAFSFSTPHAKMRQDSGKRERESFVTSSFPPTLLVPLNG